jgi:hypothetical protein
MSFNLKLASIITDSGDIDADFVVFGAPSEAAENPVLIKATALGLGVTNLSVINHNASTLDIASSSGTDTTIPAATTSLAGLMTAADKTALDGFDSGTTIAAATEGSPGVGDFLPYLTAALTPGKVEGDYYAVAAAMPELIRDTMGAALVQGANITITVNDAGDTITIAASGGGETSQLPPRSGGYIGQFCDSGSGAILSVDLIFFTPLIVTASTTIDRITAAMQSGGVSMNAKLGIYSSDAGRLPSTLVAACSAPVALDGFGLKFGTFSSNPTLTPGLYWLAMLVDSATPQPKIISNNAAFYIQNSIGDATQYLGFNRVLIRMAQSYATGLPASTSSLSYNEGQNVLMVARVA